MNAELVKKLKEVNAKIDLDGPHLIVEGSPAVSEIMREWQDQGGHVDRIQIGHRVWFEVSLGAI